MGERKEGRLATVPTEERHGGSAEWALGETGLTMNMLLALRPREASESSSRLSEPECPPG